MTYKQAVNWADDIKDYTQTRQDAAVEAGRGRRLPQRAPADRQGDRDAGRLGRWRHARGRPEGRPAPREFTDGWQLGKPDLVLTVDGDFTLGAERPRPVPLLRAADQPDRGQVRRRRSRCGRAIRASSITRCNFSTDRQGPRAGEDQRQGRKKRPPTDQDRGPGLLGGDGRRLPRRRGQVRRHRRLGAGPAAALPARGHRLPPAQGRRRRHAGPLPPQRPGREGPHRRSACTSPRSRCEQPYQGADRWPAGHSGRSSAIPAGKRRLQGQGRHRGRPATARCTRSCRTCTCSARRSR